MLTLLKVSNIDLIERSELSLMLDEASIEAGLEAEVQEFKKNKKSIEAELRELVWELIRRRAERN